MLKESRPTSHCNCDVAPAIELVRLGMGKSMTQLRASNRQTYL